MISKLYYFDFSNIFLSRSATRFRKTHFIYCHLYLGLNLYYWFVLIVSYVMYLIKIINDQKMVTSKFIKFMTVFFY